MDIRNDFLVKDYTDDSEEDPKLYIIHGNGIFAFLEKVKVEKLVVAIFDIGDCVLDWS